MPSVLDDAWLGRRVVVRRVVARDEAGRPRHSDVIGELVDLGAERIVVDARTGPVEIDRDTVAVARLVEASTADQLTLERVAARGWRARETESVDGWLLRADVGWTARANSALPLRSSGVATADQLRRVRDWYAARGLPARVHVPWPARRLLDAYLLDRYENPSATREPGWQPGAPIDVRAGRLDGVARIVGSDPKGRTELARGPDARWLARCRGGELPAGAVEVLTRHERVVFATRRGADGDIAGIARGVVDDGWLGLTTLEVLPGHRRQGHARALVADLGRWADREHRATRMYLQVDAGNAAAAALYDGLRLHRHHVYRYWTFTGDAQEPPRAGS